MADKVDRDRQKDASIDTDDLDLGSIDDIELDAPGTGDEGVESGKSRRPAKSKTKYALEGAAAFAGGVAQIGAHELKKAMPDAANIVSDVKATLDDVRELRDELTKQLAPITRSFVTAGRKLLPSAEAILPKKVYQAVQKKLDEKAKSYNEGQYQAQSKEQLETDQIKSELASIFGAQTEIQMSQERENRKEQMVDRAVGSIRHRQSTAALTHIYDATRATELFHKTQHMAYMKKSLELKYRHIFIARDTFNLLQASMKSFEGYYKALVKNTGLPDMAKLEISDYARKKRTDKWGNLIGDAMNNIRGQIFKKIKNSVQDVGGMLSLAASGLDTMGDTAEMQREFGGDKKGLPKWALKGAGALAAWAPFNRFAKKHKGIFNAMNTGAAGFRSSLLTRMADLRARWEQDPNNPLLNMLAELMPDPYQSQTSASNDFLTKAKDAATFDVATRQSITEVIPGYLGKIWHEIAMMRTGDETIDERTFNVYQRRFTSVKDLQADIYEKAFGSEETRRNSLTKTLSTMQAGAARNNGKSVTIGNQKRSISDMFRGMEKDIDLVLNNHALRGKPFNPKKMRDYIMNPNGANVDQSYIASILEGVQGDPREILDAIVASVFTADGQFDKQAFNKINLAIDDEYRRRDTFRKEFASVVETFGNGAYLQGTLTARQEEALRTILKNGTPEEKKAARAQLIQNGGMFTSSVSGNRLNMDVIAHARNRFDLSESDLRSGDSTREREYNSLRDNDKNFDKFNKSFLGRFFHLGVKGRGEGASYADIFGAPTGSAETVELDENGKPKVKNALDKLRDKAGDLKTRLTGKATEAYKAGRAKLSQVTSSDELDRARAIIGDLTLQAKTAGAKGIAGAKSAYDSIADKIGEAIDKKMAESKASTEQVVHPSMTGGATIDETLPPREEAPTGSAFDNLLEEIKGWRSEATSNQGTIFDAVVQIDDTLRSLKLSNGTTEYVASAGAKHGRARRAAGTIARGIGSTIKNVGKVYTRIYGAALRGAGTAIAGASKVAGDLLTKVGRGVRGVARWFTHKEDYVDVYVKGKPNRPIVSARMQRDPDEGIFFKSTGKRVMKSADIDQVCVDRNGNIVISEEDLNAGLVMHNDTPIGKVGKGILAFGQSYLGFYGKVISAIATVGKAIIGGVIGTKAERYVDVYRKNEVAKGPLLTARKQKEEGVYFFEDGKKVERSSDIHGIIMDKDHRILIDKADVEHGLVDVNNKPIGRSGTGLLGGIGKILGGIAPAVGAGAKGMIDIYTKVYTHAIDIIGGGIKGAGRFLGRALGLNVGGGGFGGEVDKQIRESIVGSYSTLRIIQADLALIANQYRKKNPLDKDVDGDIDGSYADQMQNKRDKNGDRVDARDVHKDVNWLKEDDEKEGGGKDGKDSGGGIFDMLSDLVPKKYRRRLKAYKRLFGRKAMRWAKGAGRFITKGGGAILRGTGNLLSKIPGVGKLGSLGKTGLSAIGKAGGGLFGKVGGLAGKAGAGIAAKGGFGALAKGAGRLAGKWAGPLAAITELGIGGYGAYQAYKAGDMKEASRQAGGGVGGAGGALGGAALGAAIGSAVPGIGTAIGGLIGGLLGAVGGSKAGKWLGGKMHEAITQDKGILKYNSVVGLIRGIRGNDNPLTEEELKKARAKLQHRAEKGMPGYDRILQEFEKAVEAKNWKRARQLSGQEADGIIASLWKHSLIGLGVSTVGKWMFGDKDKPMTEAEIQKTRDKFTAIMSKGGLKAKNAERLLNKFNDYVAELDWKNARKIAGMEKRGLFGALFQDEKGNVKWGKLAATALFGLAGWTAATLLDPTKNPNAPMSEKEIKEANDWFQKQISAGSKVAEKIRDQFNEAVMEQNWRKARKLCGKEVKSNLSKTLGFLGKTAKISARIGAALFTGGMSEVALGFFGDQDTPLKDEEIKKFRDKMNYLISKGDKLAERKLEKFDEYILRQQWEKARKIAKMPHKGWARRAGDAVVSFFIGNDEKEMSEAEIQKFRDSMNRKINLGGSIAASAQRKLDSFEDAVGRQNWRKARRLAGNPDEGLVHSVGKAVTGVARFFFGGNGKAMSDSELEQARRKLRIAVEEGRKDAQKRMDVFEDYVADEKWEKARRLVKMPYESLRKRVSKWTANLLFGGDKHKELTPDEIDEFRSKCEAEIANGSKTATKKLEAFNAAVAAENWPKARKISQIKDEGLVGSVKSGAKKVWNWLTGNKDRKDCEEMREELEDKAMDDNTGIINAGLDQFNAYVRRRQFNQAIALGKDMLKMKPSEFAKKHKFSTKKYEELAKQANELAAKIQKEEDENNGWRHPIKEMQLASLRRKVMSSSDQWDDEFFDEIKDELGEITGKADYLSEGSKPDNETMEKGQRLLDIIKKQRDKHSYWSSPIVKSRLSSLYNEVKSGVMDWDDAMFDTWEDQLEEIDDSYMRELNMNKGDPNDPEFKKQQKNRKEAEKLIKIITRTREKYSWLASPNIRSNLEALRQEVRVNSDLWSPDQFARWYQKLTTIDIDGESLKSINLDSRAVQDKEAREMLMIVKAKQKFAEDAAWLRSKYNYAASPWTCKRINGAKEECLAAENGALDNGYERAKEHFDYWYNRLREIDKNDDDEIGESGRKWKMFDEDDLKAEEREADNKEKSEKRRKVVEQFGKLFAIIVESSTSKSETKETRDACKKLLRDIAEYMETYFSLGNTRVGYTIKLQIALNDWIKRPNIPPPTDAFAKQVAYWAEQVKKIDDTINGVADVTKDMGELGYEGSDGVAAEDLKESKARIAFAKKFNKEANGTPTTLGIEIGDMEDPKTPEERGRRKLLMPVNDEIRDYVSSLPHGNTFGWAASPKEHPTIIEFGERINAWKNRIRAIGGLKPEQLTEAQPEQEEEEKKTDTTGKIKKASDDAIRKAIKYYGPIEVQNQPWLANVTNFGDYAQERSAAEQWEQASEKWPTREKVTDVYSAMQNEQAAEGDKLAETVRKDLGQKAATEEQGDKQYKIRGEVVGDKLTPKQIEIVRRGLAIGRKYPKAVLDKYYEATGIKPPASEETAATVAGSSAGEQAAADVGTPDEGKAPEYSIVPVHGTEICVWKDGTGRVHHTKQPPTAADFRKATEASKEAARKKEAFEARFNGGGPSNVEEEDEDTPASEEPRALNTTELDEKGDPVEAVKADVGAPDIAGAAKAASERADRTNKRIARAKEAYESLDTTKCAKWIMDQVKDINKYKELCEKHNIHFDEDRTGLSTLTRYMAEDYAKEHNLKMTTHGRYKFRRIVEMKVQSMSDDLIPAEDTYDEVSERKTDTGIVRERRGIRIAGQPIRKSGLTDKQMGIIGIATSMGNTDYPDYVMEMYNKQLPEYEAKMKKKAEEESDQRKDDFEDQFADGGFVRSKVRSLANFGRKLVTGEAGPEAIFPLANRPGNLLSKVGNKLRKLMLGKDIGPASSDAGAGTPVHADDKEAEPMINHLAKSLSSYVKGAFKFPSFLGSVGRGVQSLFEKAKDKVDITEVLPKQSMKELIAGKLSAVSDLTRKLQRTNVQDITAVPEKEELPKTAPATQPTAAQPTGPTTVKLEEAASMLKSQNDMAKQMREMAEATMKLYALMSMSFAKEGIKVQGLDSLAAICASGANASAQPQAIQVVPVPQDNESGIDLRKKQM